MRAAQIARSARLRRVHEFLRDGQERSTLEIVTGAGVCAVSPCISELRQQGAEIECRVETSGDVRRWLYRMTRPIPRPKTAPEV
jgi:uridine phosphorylase